MYSFFSLLGHHFVCRPACLPRQHEGPLGTVGAQGEVLWANHQSDVGKHRCATGEAEVRQRNRFPAQQVCFTDPSTPTLLLILLTLALICNVCVGLLQRVHFRCVPTVLRCDRTRCQEGWGWGCQASGASSVEWSALPWPAGRDSFQLASVAPPHF